MPAGRPASGLGVPTAREVYHRLHHTGAIDQTTASSWGRGNEATGEEIVVAGDVHLGAANADVAAFDAFLDDLARRPPGRLVLLGDVWDLLRRDPFGCAWETSGTIGRLKTLAAEIPVHVLPGNHDGHLHHLDGDRYEFDVVTDLVVESGGDRIRFVHGDDFDGLQFDAVTRWFEGPGDRGDMDPTRGRKDPLVAWGREVLQRGKRGLRAVRTDGGAATAFPRRERRAHDFLESIPEEKLVYGHTHAPYVHPDNVAANPGSWKRTAPVHGTYLVVEDGEIELFRHRSGRPDVGLDSA